MLLRQRPEQGLLARMIEVPVDRLGRRAAGDRRRRCGRRRCAATGGRCRASSRHVFTHFKLELVVHVAIVPADVALTFWADSARCRWVPRRALAGQALPSVMRKIIAHALKEM